MSRPRCEKKQTNNTSVTSSAVDERQPDLPVEAGSASGERTVAAGEHCVYSGPKVAFTLSTTQARVLAAAGGLTLHTEPRMSSPHRGGLSRRWRKSQPWKACTKPVSFSSSLPSELTAPVLRLSKHLHNIKFHHTPNFGTHITKLTKHSLRGLMFLLNLEGSGHGKNEACNETSHLCAEVSHCANVSCLNYYQNL